jgi:hypothetical protein
MVEFRKWFPALALIAVLLGSAAMASAQTGMTCQTSSGTPPFVRSEGIAELLGDIVLLCTGGTPTPAGQPVAGVNINVLLNTNITSRLLSTDPQPLTESLLLIDEPVAGAQVACPPAITTTSAFSPVCPIIGTAAAGSVGPSGATPGGVNYKASGIPNVFQSRLISSGTQTYLSWAGVPIDAPGTVGTRVIRITNIRGDASTFGSGTTGTFGFNPIVAFVSINPSTSISVPNPQQQIGLPIRGLGGFDVFSGTSGTNKLVPFLQCQGNEVNTTGPAFRARFTEGFNSAFRPRTVNPGISAAVQGGGALQFAPGQSPYGLPTPSGLGTYNASAASVTGTAAAQGNPGQQIFTESGLYNPVVLTTSSTPFPGSLTSFGEAGLATQGTRLIVRFTNIPNGVTVYGSLFEQGNMTGGATSANSRIALVCGADANGAGGAPCSTGTTVNGVSNLQAATLSNGTGALVYEVITSDPFILEYFDIPIHVAFPANGGALTPSNALPTVSGALAPISTVHTASNTAPAPRFVDQAITSQTFLINPCRTNLLFPFVTNQFGFDTGIAISNTSQDPFGTTTQSGPCTINYYGSTLGGGAAPAAQRTTAPVPAGSTFTFTLGLGSGSGFGITGATAFSGYIIATCDFQYAHGFAFITDGPIGTARVAEGYLALVMDAPVGSRTSYQSESLNQ